jgi:virginiamycin B lyase
MRCLLMVLTALAVASASAHAQESKYYELPKGDYPHDVAVGLSGEVWYAGQNLGIAGRLNPASGAIESIPLGKKSAPHGVIVGPDGAPWFTDGGSQLRKQNPSRRGTTGVCQNTLWKTYGTNTNIVLAPTS